ncbi:MAG: hypothetical protein Q9219_002037 [cf. Caloplaca sp. 3 TL-2023]
MEKPYASKETSPFEIYQDPVEVYFDQVQVNKPLPPTPRKASSVYSMQREEEQPARQQRPRHDLLQSPVFLAPTAYRSSTSRLPDPTPVRPKLTREAQTHATSDPLIKQRRDHEERSNVSTRASNLQQELSLDSLTIAIAPHSLSKSAAYTEAKTLEKSANGQIPPLTTRSRASPTSTLERDYANHQRDPSPMSGRITNVVDHSLVPAPLRISSFEESERPPSRFSSSSSEPESYHEGTRNSLRGLARKVFHSRNGSKDTDKTDWAAFTRFQERRSSTSRRQSRDALFGGARRESLRRSISGMYDTLTSLTTPSKKIRPLPVATDHPPKPHKPRLKSPAIPLSPYQEMGPQAWQRAQKASKKTAKSDMARMEGGGRVSSSSHDTGSRLRFSTPTYKETLPQPMQGKGRSVITKLASALSSGTVQVEGAVGLNTARVKRTRSEKKREELKRKIKVIGLGEPNTGKVGAQWL